MYIHKCIINGVSGVDKPRKISRGGPAPVPPSIVHGSREALNNVLEATTFETSCRVGALSCKWFQAPAN